MDINSLLRDPNNWKKTSRKVHKAYVCIPPVGTFVKCDFKNTIMKTSKDNRVVLYGTFGYLPITLQALVSSYCMPDGNDITERDIEKNTVRGEEPYVKWFEVKSKPNNDTIWAFRIPEEIRNLPVPASNGLGTITANMVGKDYCDFIICMDINGEPFIDRIDFCN